MKIGTIGTGSIVDRFIAATRTCPNCDVLACYSRSLEKGQEFATKNAISTVYTDLDEMLKDPQLDFIYVASPNSLHFPQSKAALLAGKNVISEKPFTSNARECKELIELAKEKNLYLFEAIIPIHLPNYKWLKGQLSQVGNLKLVQCNFSQYSSRYDAFKAGKNPNVFNLAFSGGALMDINLYNIHFTMGLFGKPKAVHYYPNLEDGIDTSGVVVLEYNHFIASLVGCKDSKSKNISQIQGDKGFFTINQESSRCLSIEANIGPRQTFYSTQEEANGMHYELMDFLEIVANHDMKACHDLLDYSLTVMEVIDEARKDAGIVFAADEVNP